jgi:hypothetical protein
MLVIQIIETDAESDSIVINKPQIFMSYSDPELTEYINNKIDQDRSPPDMKEWTLEEVDAPVVKKKRGRPRKVKVPLIDDFMEIDN